MPRLAIKVKQVAEKAIKQGHPWVYATAIIKQSGEGQAGDLCILYDQRRNQLFAIGLYDPLSPIRIKVIHNEGPAVIDHHFWLGKIRTAMAIRQPLLETETDSYRLLHGENDGVPGLIVDVYADVVVCKIYSPIWQPHIDTIYDLLVVELEPTAVVQRASRALVDTGVLADGVTVRGVLADPLVHFTEHGIRFSAHVLLGHKTGYFLDHRHNRLRVGQISAGKAVLDVFSYAGGFSAHAAAGGAHSVCSIDISKQALEVARYNVNLNPHSCSHETMAMDAFAALADLEVSGHRYDIVIVDPPSFAKKAEEIPDALRSYRRLAKQAARLVTKGGILLLASCSARVTSEDFFAACESGLQASQRNYRLIDQTFHDIDHPITFAQGSYLKTAYYAVS